MAEVPAKARCVVIGAGIVGNSLVYHLARLGWRDIVQIDKGPLPNPGGSTGHASNFIFPVDHSRENAEITLDSMAQYKEMGVFTESGGFEVARTEERMQELRRRMSSAKAWGIEAEMVSPAFVKEKVPFIEEDVIIGAFWTPSVGVVDSLRAGTIMRERALELGALKVIPTVEVTGLKVEDEKIVGVETTGGFIEAETVVIAAGVWSPKVAAMAGIELALIPTVHQMISVGPCKQLAEIPGEISFPIVRDMDTLCYERQHGADMEVGSYAHRAIMHDPEDIPSNEQAKLSPTEMPFTQDDFDPQLEQAYELMPELLGGEGAEIRYAINGLLSMTADGSPILGEFPEVKNLWVSAAVWIKEGPGTGRAVAELMTQGYSEIDISHSDVARFYPHQKKRDHVKSRTNESFIKTYGIVHPAEQWGDDRDQRLSPMKAKEKELGAVFYEAVGWERPQWFESNAKLLDKYSDEQLMTRTAEWDARWWSPIINAEHLEMRENAGIVDLSSFAIFDLKGAGAKESVQRTIVSQADVADGRVIYTPVLNANGGFVSDLTVMKIADDHYRVVTGGAHGMVDLKWFKDRMVEGTEITDLTNDLTTIGIWGPKARDILSGLTSDDVSNEGFTFGTFREIDVQGITVLASRISYVGELGWELYVPMADGAKLYDLLLEAGAEHGAIPVGIGVYVTSGRIEKGYRAFGMELDGDRSIVEAGMQRPKVKAADFEGKEAYLKQREEAPKAVMCTLTVDDHTSSTGEKRYMLGGEPIVTRDGGQLTDGHGHHPYVTTAGSAPSLGKHVLLAYLPPENAKIGEQLAVYYLEELYPVTVGSVDSTSLFDPENARIRG